MEPSSRKIGPVIKASLAHFWVLFTVIGFVSPRFLMAACPGAIRGSGPCFAPTVALKAFLFTVLSAQIRKTERKTIWKTRKQYYGSLEGHASEGGNWDIFCLGVDTLFFWIASADRKSRRRGKKKQNKKRLARGPCEGPAYGSESTGRPVNDRPEGGKVINRLSTDFQGKNPSIPQKTAKGGARQVFGADHGGARESQDLGFARGRAFSFFRNGAGGGGQKRKERHELPDGGKQAGKEESWASWS